MSDLAARIKAGARAERERLEAQAAVIDRRLAIVATIEQLADDLDGHGTAGEAPPATAPGGGVSPARSVPTGAGARQRPAQRAAAGPAPKPHSHESGRRRRDQVLDAIGQGHGKLAEISEATGIAKGGLKDMWMLWEHARHGTPAAAKPGHEASGLIEDGGEDYAPAPNFDHAGREVRAGVSHGE